MEWNEAPQTPDGMCFRGMGRGTVKEDLARAEMFYSFLIDLQASRTKCQQLSFKLERIQVTAHLCAFL